jgi:hypothetical protein
MKKTATHWILERRGQLKDLDRSFDISYWQRLEPDAIFEAAWQMVCDSFQLTGKRVSERRLQKSMKNLADFQVKYLVVGGYSVMFYTEPRYTKDLGIWVETSEENSKKLSTALNSELPLPV